MRDFSTAVAKFTALLELLAPPRHAPITASAHAQRGAALLRLKRLEECLRDTGALGDGSPVWGCEEQAIVRCLPGKRWSALV